MARPAILRHLLRSSQSTLLSSRSLHSGSCIHSYGLWKQCSFGVDTFPEIYLNFASPHIDSHGRWASSQSAAANTAGSESKISIGPQKFEVTRNDKDSGAVYYGPISSTIKKVKLLSLSTCCLSVSLALS